MTNAKLVAMSDIDEREVTLEIKGITLICFVMACPYKIYMEKNYPVEFAIQASDETELLELNRETYAFKKIGEGFGYILQGKLSNGKLDMGIFSIEDEFLEQFPLLDGKYVELEVEGLWVDFLPQN